MRTTLKLVLPLAVSVICVSLLYAAYQVRTERRNLRNDLARRAATLAESLQESLEALSGRSNDKNLQRIVERFGQREHLLGVAIYDRFGTPLAITPGLPERFGSRPAAANEATKLDAGFGEFFDAGGDSFYTYSLPLHRDAEQSGALVVIYDTSYIEHRISLSLRDSLLTALLQTLLITSLAFILVRWNFTTPLASTARWLRTLRAGSSEGSSNLPHGELFDEIHTEAKHLAHDLDTARAAAQEEAQLRETQSSVWTAERLRVSLANKLGDKPLFLVSNREPYMHVFQEKNNAIQTIVPASGLVTALEPVLQACHGTWIANGSGSADREVVDALDHLQVPPDRPTYTLRRVWLTDEEDRGYYEGFSNEGLWPLCHIAHTRPIFRLDDWLQYQKINRRFADAVLQEMAGTQSPILLAQDYHFALLPRMVKEARPDAAVAIFWHIPWPNPEVFGICPWQRELVDGLLGADLIGFHIQTHCNNFLETVDRALEALTEWDRFAVNRKGHTTRVRPYPISVAFSPNENQFHGFQNSGEERAALCAELGIEASLLGVGVDRVDYTKGILERFRAIERFLELYPEYQQRFSFVQIAAPSRTDIPRYRQFLQEVAVEAERINARYPAAHWKPIVLLKRHHSHEEILRYYRAASVCLVTSLHDGMNLVAKEFVAARDDERGALILSTFAGAANELVDSLLINPYDVQQLADAIRQALEMSPEEQGLRMARMRKTVHEHNVYRWAANLISDLTEIRIAAPELRGASLPS
ncbi:MAG TPA: trehalose-6-phosphate synthase [Candidatus Acidoferrum sp.]|nr:trehalose-6-phosphate synthase [Candidatus Acidoferrum sp.]